MESTGLKGRHLRVLAALCRGASTQQLLADAVRTDANQLVAVLNELEAADLVARRRHPDDRRRHIVELTKAGAAKLADARHRVDEVEQRLLAGLDADSRALFSAMLEKLAANSGAAVDCASAAEISQDIGRC
jgi:DNA-binding MarR family transcriptional regulator